MRLRTYNIAATGREKRRGNHRLAADLIADVFAEEPLPTEHVLWRHPKVVVTPHLARLSEPDSGAARMVEALRAVRAGRTPAHLVDRADYPTGPAELGLTPVGSAS
jgi:hypothetical protein